MRGGYEALSIQCGNRCICRELYEDGDNIQNEEGVTMIVPPPYEPGQVPVFDKLGQEWRVVPLSIVRQLVIHGKN